MTRENFTSINVIIDASGSMRHLQFDTIGSFNTFLKEQQAVPGEAAFTLCSFNTSINLVHDFAKLGAVPMLDAKTYAPTGGTALLDAIGTTIDSVGAKLAALDESERPSKVLFLVVTDGHENSSRVYSPERIKDMVQHQKDVYSWEFVFMGANIDAITAGANLGVSTQNTLNYVPTAAGTADLYRSISANTTQYRASNSSRADFFNQGVSPLVDAAGHPIVSPTTPGSGSK